MLDEAASAILDILIGLPDDRANKIEARRQQSSHRRASTQQSYFVSLCDRRFGLGTDTMSVISETHRVSSTFDKKHRVMTRTESRKSLSVYRG